MEDEIERVKKEFEEKKRMKDERTKAEKEKEKDSKDEKKKEDKSDEVCICPCPGMAFPRAHLTPVQKKKGTSTPSPAPEDEPRVFALARFVFPQTHIALANLSTELSIRSD